MWDLTKALFWLALLIILLAIAIFILPLLDIYQKERYTRSLPEPTITDSEVQDIAREVLRQACVTCKTPQGFMFIGRAFKEAGLNEHDRHLVVTELVDRKLIKRHSFLPNAIHPTEIALTEYTKEFTRESKGTMNIQTGGDFNGGINFHSPSGNIQAGRNNTNSQNLKACREVSEALLRDAESATEEEARTARYIAEDLVDAGEAGDSGRIDRLLSRAGNFISSANSAFTLASRVLGLGG